MPRDPVRSKPKGRCDFPGVGKLAIEGYETRISDGKQPNNWFETCGWILFSIDHAPPLSGRPEGEHFPELLMYFYVITNPMRKR